MSARLSPIHRAHPLIPVCRSAGTHTTATPAVAQILWTGSITLSALIRVNKRKSSMDDNSRCSSNGATSNPRAMSSVSRTQAAMASSLARNFCVCLYVRWHGPRQTSSCLARKLQKNSIVHQRRSGPMVTKTLGAAFPVGENAAPNGSNRKPWKARFSEPLLR